MCSFRRSLALSALMGLTLAATVAAQQPTTSDDFRWAKALRAGSRVELKNVNGDVTVTTASGGEVEVVGRRRRGSDADIRVQVVETSNGVVACVVWRGDDCDEDGYRGRRDGWNDEERRGRIDLEVRVPRGMHVSAGSVSGDVALTGVEGEVRASSVSGDVRVQGIRAQSLNASSVSGDIEASVDALTGTGDLRFSSVSGNVVAELPKDFSADLRMTTVSGSIDSAYPITIEGRTGRSRLEGRIGSGGRRLTVSTVSGDLRLRARQ